MKQVNITLEDLFNLPTAVIYNPDDYKPVRFVSLDSRTIKKNSLFVAIEGERLDGHKFIKEAVKKGASAVMINKNKFNRIGDINLPVIVVEDTTAAYGALANVWRHKLKAKVVALTGSNGKTTTKEMIAQLLSTKYDVVKSLANNNNHIGVPLTIFEANEKTGVLVLEHGTNHFNEIPYTADISEPDIALITNIGKTHLEFLIDRDGVYREKSELLKVTDNRNGLVLINNDDEYLRKNKKSFKNSVTYGFKGKVDIKGKVSNFTEEGFPVVEIEGKGKRIKVELPLYGEANAKNYLAAVATVMQFGLKKSEIIKGTQNIKPVKRRMEPVVSNKTILIDDSYNSNPDSARAAFEALRRIKKHPRKILILGDMYELGRSEKKLHKELAGAVLNSKADEVYTIGRLMKNLHAALPNSKIIKKHFNGRDSLKKFLRNIELEETAVLVKASRGMNMEEFVEILKARVN